MISFFMGLDCFLLGSIVTFLFTDHWRREMVGLAKEALKGWDESIKIGKAAVKIIEELQAKLKAYEKIPSQPSGVSND